MRRLILDRFWEKIDVSAGPDACWPWIACITSDGYGQFGLGNRVRVRAHRFAYELTKGVVVPAGLVMDHLCRNTVCCNPAHLEPVTPAENARRAVHPCRIGEGRKSHCKHGHELAGDNVRIVYRCGKPERSCRECGRIWAREYQRQRTGYYERNAA